MIVLFRNKLMQFGDDIGPAFNDIIEKIEDLGEEEELRPSAALKKIIEENLLSEFAQKLAAAFGRQSSTEIERVLTKLLNTLENVAKKEELTDRQLGWPAREWTRSIQDEDEQSGFMLMLGAEGSIFAEVLREGTTLPEPLTAPTMSSALTRVHLSGEIAFDIGGEINLLRAAASASAEGSLRRELNYYFSHTTSSQRAGLALGQILSLTRAPNDYDGLLAAMKSEKRTRLSGLVIEGGENFGAEAEISANLPTQYGTFGVELGGSINFAPNFSYSISALGDADNPEGLSVKIESGREYSNSVNVGVSYSIGFSTIAPGQIDELLGRVSGLGEPLEILQNRATDVVQRVASWLKPGTLLNNRLSDQLNELLSAETVSSEEALIVGQALAGLFGLTDEFVERQEETSQRLSALFSDLLSGLIDDALGVVSGDTQALSNQLQTALSQRLNDEAMMLLNQGVFRQIVPDLREMLQKTLDEATTNALQQLLGFEPEDKLEAVQDFIERSRSIGMTLIERLSQSQGELLAAEIAWERARSKTSSIGFTAEFMDSDAKSKKAFSDLVLHPRRAGNLLFDKNLPAGVSVSGEMLQRRLFKSKGPRWNLAFIAPFLSSSTTSTTEIEIMNIKGSVAIVSGGRIERTKTLFGETRKVGFLSAFNLFEAKGRSEDAQEDAEPRAPVSLAVEFEEEDGKWKEGETKRTLERLVTFGVISKTSSSELRAAMFKTSNKVAGTLSLSLAIPPSEALNVLLSVERQPQLEAYSVSESTFGTQSIVDEELETSLFEAIAITEPEFVDQIESDLATLGLIESGQPAGLNESTFHESVPVSETSKISSRVNILKIAKNFEPPWVSDLEATQESIFEAENESVEMLSKRRLRVVKKARQSFIEILRKGVEIYRKETPLYLFDPEKKAQHAAFERSLEEDQAAINKLSKKFIRAGDLFNQPFDKIPRRTVAFFKAMQIYTSKTTGVTPPMMMTFKPENGTTITMVSDQ